MTNLPAICTLEQGRQHRIVTVLSPLSQPPGFWLVEDQTDGSRFTVHRQQITLMPTVPSRFKQAQFNRFAPVLGEALRNYPAVTVVDPQGLAVETYSARCRDARTAKQNFHYTHPAIDENLFAKHGADLEFSMHGSNVLIGSRDAIREYRNAGSAAVGIASTARLRGSQTETALSPRHIETYCLLVHQKAFDPPLVNVTVTGLTPAQVEDLENRYDVALAPVAGSEGKYQII